MDDILFSFLVLFILFGTSLCTSYDGPMYDHSAYTECKLQPEKPLYNGGILGIKSPDVGHGIHPDSESVDSSPAFILRDITPDKKYALSAWIKVAGADSAHIRASLMTDQRVYDCVGTVLAKEGCWSFLKGGFVPSSHSKISMLFFQTMEDKDINIEIASTSLQPFTDQEWSTNQQYIINTERKRAVTVHVSDVNGDRLRGAEINIEQISKDFPIGSAIASTILGNLPYQKWFTERFNAAVFENELKWYATEPEPGKINYTIADQMLKFVRANQIIARGHNIFWEDPQYTPAWVRNLSDSGLVSAVNSRIKSLMSNYKDEFIHWDVSNEMLHFDFYEQRLGPNATLHFYETAHESDPLATLFMNDFNVVETCSDIKSTVDSYISRLVELKRGGATMDGIGLEGHFSVPNPPLMRAIMDKLATMELPMWLTEVDINKNFDNETQAVYLEQVLREGFSHPGIDGIMLWTAIGAKGCYQMCLTDNNMQNFPAGDVVDKLLKEWQTGQINGQTDDHGSFSFFGFLGEYVVRVSYSNRTTNSTFSVGRGDETRHFSIHL